MPRRLLTPHLLELTHVDCPGVIIRAHLRPSSVLGVPEPAIDLIQIGARLNGMTAREVRHLCAMLGDAADFSEGL